MITGKLLVRILKLRIKREPFEEMVAGEKREKFRIQRPLIFTEEPHYVIRHSRIISTRNLLENLRHD